MDKNTAIQKMTKILKPRVVCRFPKQRQSKVFREICNEAFAICSVYTKELNASILADTLNKERKGLYEKAFLFGKKHWTNIAIAKGRQDAVSIIKSQPLLRRLWWAINPGKMKIHYGSIVGERNEVDNG